MATVKRNRLTMVQACKLHDFLRDSTKIAGRSSAGIASMATAELGFKVASRSVELLAKELGITIRRQQRSSVYNTRSKVAWPIVISILADIAGEDDPRIAQLRSIFSEQAK